MTNDQTSKAVLEEVKNLRRWHDKHSWYADDGQVDKLCRLFPSIASLAEEQAKRIEELESLLIKSLEKMRVMHKQTGGEYGGGVPLHWLIDEIKQTLPPSNS